MILFSSINQGLVLWLFCYVGLVSGIIFFVIFSCGQIAISKKISIRWLRPLKKEKALRKDDSLSLREIVKNRQREKKLKRKQERFLLKEKMNQQKMAKKKKNMLEKNVKSQNKKEKKQPTANLATQKNKIELQEKRKALKAKRQKAWYKFTSKTKNVFLSIIKFLKRTFISIICLTTFVACIVNMLIINLNYNFGETNMICILAFVLSFVAGVKLVKLLANFFLCLYNKRKRNVNEKN